MKTSEFVIQRLIDWGVDRIFGYAGDGINPLLAALDKAEKDIQFIQARHEVAAAFMACGHAKFAGQIGVCMATAGPGAVQLLNGLYDAKLDNQPVLAIIGQQPRNALGSDYQQDVDLVSLYKDVAHEYVNVATTASQVRHLLDRSIRTALSQRTVTCLILPHDVQDLDAEPQPEREKGQSFSGVGYSAPIVVPRVDDLREAAKILNYGQRVAILIGAGAAGAADEVMLLADVLGAGVAKALLGKAVLPDDLPFVTGAIGMLGTEATQMMMDKCDTLLMIGSNFPYAEFLPKEGQARGVQIDIDGRNLSLRYPMDVSLQGDSRETLKELLPLLIYKSDRSWRTQIEESVFDWWKVVEGRAEEPAEPVNPQLVFWKLSEVLPDESVLCADSGTSTVWFARDLKLRAGMMASTSGGLASMGGAIPYAVAAKFAHPNRSAFAFVGDGAMQMSGNAELLTVAKYWKQWTNPHLIVVVLNNRDLNFVTWEQRVFEGNPKFAASQDLPGFSYANYADSIGLLGITVRTADDISSALNDAILADRPVVIDVHADPNVPPIPPKVDMEQAQAFASSALKGDSDSPKTFVSSLGQVLKSLFPSSR